MKKPQSPCFTPCAFANTLAALTVAALTLAPSASYAVNASWNGGTDGTWAATGNWSASPVPGSADTATFNGAGNTHTTIDLGTGVAVKTITFDTANAAAYTIGAGAVGSQSLTFSNGGGITVTSLDTANQTINANVKLGPTANTAETASFSNASTSATLTVNGAISAATTGTKTLTITGAGKTILSGDISDGLGVVALNPGNAAGGVTTLSGNNTFSGGASVNRGTLNINSSTALGTGTFTLLNSSTIDNTTGGLITNANNNQIKISSSFTFAGTNSLDLGTGDVTLGGAGTATITANTLTLGGNIYGGAFGYTKSGAGTLILKGGIHYTGVTSVLAGTLVLAGDNSNATGGVKITAGTLNINSATAVSGTLNIAGGTIDNTSNSALSLSSNPTQVWGGSYTFAGSNDLGLGNGAITMSAATTVTTVKGTLTDNGAIAATTNTLTKAGAGRLILGGANVYTGNTTISDGALQANDGTGLPTGSFLVLNGGVLQSNGAATFTRGIASSGASKFQFGTNGGGFAANGGQMTVNLGGAGAEQVWGTTSASQIVGTLQFGSATANAKTLFQNGIDLNNTTTTGLARTIKVTAGLGGDSAEISGAIRNSKAATDLVKTGNGTLLLSGINTYSGKTNILEGTLAVGSGGSLANTTEVDVAQGAALINNGVVGGAVSVLGQLSGGGTIGNGLSVASTATLSLQLNMSGGLHEQVTVAGGDVSLHGTLELLLNGGSLQIGDGLALLVNSGNGVITEAFDHVKIDNQTIAVTNNSFNYNGQDYLLSAANLDGGTSGPANDLELIAAAVPEPGTWAMVVTGVGALVFCQRSRRRFSRNVR